MIDEGRAEVKLAELLRKCRESRARYRSFKSLERTP
jgi:hypothetical protein